MSRGLTGVNHLEISRGACVRVVMLMLVLLLDACSTLPDGRSRMTSPAPIGDVYSELDMRVQLITSSSVAHPCSNAQCMIDHDFDRRVQYWGTRLARAAFDLYPDLAKRVSSFKFEVAEKEGFGSVSNASGTVVIFRGEQNRHPDDRTLAILLAREMGHVVAQHHDDNAAPRIILSALTAILFPAFNIVRAATPASFFGSKLILAGLKPGQLREADAIAMKLLGGLGWSKRDFVIALDSSPRIDVIDPWSKPSPSLM